MEIAELQSLIATPTDLIKTIKEGKPDPEPDVYFEPELHKVTKTEERPDKTIQVPNGIIDAATGKEGTRTKTEKVARITLSLQKTIIDEAVDMAVGVPIEIDSSPANPTEETMNAMVRKTLKDNKTSFDDAEILELTMRDKECAEIWYSEKVDPSYWEGVSKGVAKMRMRIVAPSKGDKLYPIFNIEGDMVAFGRGYEIKRVLYFDLYTEKSIYKYSQSGKDWILDSTVSIEYGKIPVIYYSQPKTETADVNGKIERLETLLSNHADTNDYNGSPILAASGEIAGFSAKGETGKVFELLEGGKLEYVTWNNAPESIKMEIENLIKFIEDETRTLNLTPETIKGLGALSGIALKLLFTKPHLKAKKRQNGSYGKSIQRRFNFLKSAMAAINIDVKGAVGMDITPKFGLYMPDNVTEAIENYTALVTAGILSKKTALTKLAKTLGMEPEEVEAEMDLLAKERDILEPLE